MKTKVMICTMVLLFSVFTGIALGALEDGYNTFYGTGAGASVTEYVFATFIGAYSGFNNTSGNMNTFLGYGAGYQNIAGGGNTILGAFAGFANTGSYNTFLGLNAGNTNYGFQNTFLGANAGLNNSIGNWNTFLGSHAGHSDNGYANTIIGTTAGYLHSSGNNNVFIGNNAGENNISGEGNIFLGYYAGQNETGSNKLYIANNGTSTPLIYGEFDNQILTINGKLGIGTTTPTQKIDLGGGALTLNGSDNTGAMPPGISSQSYDPGRVDFGYGGTGGGNLEAYSMAPPNYSSPVDDRRGKFKFVYGGGNFGGVDYVYYNGSTWVTTMWLTKDGWLNMYGGAYTNGSQWIDGSSREYKENIRDLGVDEAMDTLKGLSPVKFNYKADSKETHVGFVAEDAPALVATNDRKGMSPMDVVAVLTKVVQELKAENEGLKAKNESLENRLLAIETLIKTPR